MNFKFQTSPHIRIKNTSVPHWMINVIISLVPVMVAATMIFRTSYLIVLAVSLVTIVGLEFLVSKLLKKEQTITDYSAIVTAIIYSLTLPSHTPIWIVVIGGIFAILLGKIVFGGLGSNIFNPAGIGRIIVLVAFASSTSYVLDGITSATPLALYQTGGIEVLNKFTLSTLFVGNTPGSFGEVSALAIICGAIYLVVFKVADWKKIVATIGMFSLACTVYAFNSNLGFDFVLFQLFSGSILFGAVYMVTDPITAPVTPPSTVLYAIMIGGLIFLIRVIGHNYVEGTVFAILIMNMFSPVLDYSRWASSKFTWKWILTIVIAIALFCLLAYLGSGGIN